MTLTYLILTIYKTLYFFYLISLIMSVDKFGRHEISHLHSKLRGPPGVGFQLTLEQDYDINGKLLRNVGEPQKPNDAATMKYIVSNSIVRNSKKNGNNFDAR